MKLALLFLLTITQLFSAPALDRVREFSNADGTTFMAKGQGNQHLNWILTVDGEILKFNQKSKNFEYAQVKENRLSASGVKYEKSNSKRARSLGNISKVKSSDVYRLWQEKQAEHHKRKVDAKR